MEISLLKWEEKRGNEVWYGGEWFYDGYKVDFACKSI